MKYWLCQREEIVNIIIDSYFILNISTELHLYLVISRPLTLLFFFLSVSFSLSPCDIYIVSLPLSLSLSLSITLTLSLYLPFYIDRKWIWQTDLKSTTRLFSFLIAVISFAKLFMQLFPLQLRVNRKENNI